MSDDCCNQPGTPDVEANTECCEVPKTLKGWTDNEVFYYQFGGRMIRGTGTASSTISQQDATDKAKEAARQNAILKAGCGTPPIGGTQLFCAW